MGLACNPEHMAVREVCALAPDSQDICKLGITSRWLSEMRLHGGPALTEDLVAVMIIQQTCSKPVFLQEPAARIPLYRVRFTSADVWEGNEQDGSTIDIEVRVAGLHHWGATTPAMLKSSLSEAPVGMRSSAITEQKLLSTAR